ncbi:hypothetical protein BD413DRAFT_469027 [Trametes elegans]|nr:hypothetical protein BD413DRAFT_469027 [Trametes elegans]
MFWQLISAPLEKARSYFHPARNASPSLSAPSSPDARSGSPRTARTLSAASTITLAPPKPTVAPLTPTQPGMLTTLNYQSDLIADFWGGRSQGMQVQPRPSGDSREETKKRRLPSVETVDAEQTPRRQPRTLARTLFMLGFVFPLFWIAGVVILFRPTRYEPDLERVSVGSAEEMRLHKAAYRAAEEKWARRCLWACTTLLSVTVIVVLTAVLATKNM